MGHSDSRPPISPPFVTFGWRYHPCASFAPSGRARGRGLRGVGVPVPEPELLVEADGAPKFLGTPRVPWPCSSTPAGSVAPGHRGAPTRSPRTTRARTPAMIFRGSTARPGHSLSTLRGGSRLPPRKTRFRLLAKLCRAGFVHPQGSNERFLSSSLVLLSQASWRNVDHIHDRSPLTAFVNRRLEARTGKASPSDPRPPRGEPGTVVGRPLQPCPLVIPRRVRLDSPGRRPFTPAAAIHEATRPSPPAPRNFFFSTSSAPAGTSPVSTYFHSATRSFRATATIPTLRSRVFPAANRL
jgi:hypothetical protein